VLVESLPSAPCRDPRLICRCNTGSGHQSPGLWRNPDDKSWKFTDVEHWVELAKLLENAKFHGIFIADVLGEEALSWGFLWIRVLMLVQVATTFTGNPWTQRSSLARNGP